MLAPLRLEDDEETVTRKMRLVATFIELMLARRMWNFRTFSYNSVHYRAFLTMKDIRWKSLEELREELIRRLSPERPWETLQFDSNLSKFCFTATMGPLVQRLLARMTDFLEVQSGRDSRYREDSRGGYQVEDLWSDHPEWYAD